MILNSKYYYIFIQNNTTVNDDCRRAKRSTADEAEKRAEEEWERERQEEVRHVYLSLLSLDYVHLHLIEISLRFLSYHSSLIYLDLLNYHRPAASLLTDGSVGSPAQSLRFPSIRYAQPLLPPSLPFFILPSINFPTITISSRLPSTTPDRVLRVTDGTLTDTRDPSPRSAPTWQIRQGVTVSVATLVHRHSITHHPSSILSPGSLLYSLEL